MKDISRTGHVDRWHAVRTLRSQKVSEHLYLVTMIAREMANQIYNGTISPEDTLALIDYTLRHDLPEVITGDVNGALKRHMEQMNGGKDLLREIEYKIDPQYKAAKERVSNTPLEAIAKLADIADAIAFISVEGFTKHAQAIKEKRHLEFLKKIGESQGIYPDLNWNAACDVLDELLNGHDNQIEFEL